MAWNKTPEFRALQAKWYKKLKDDGFKDAERWTDLNKIPATSMPSKHVSTHMSDPGWERTGTNFYGSESDEWEFGQVPDDPTNPLHTQSLAESERALYWQEVGRKVNDLPRTFKHRKALLSWAESGSASQAARKHGIGIDAMKGMVRAFLVWAGLPPYRVRGKAKPVQKPEPVKHLLDSRTDYMMPEFLDIADDLTPPKQIKTKTGRYNG